MLKVFVCFMCALNLGKEGFGVEIPPFSTTPNRVLGQKFPSFDMALREKRDLSSTPKPSFLEFGIWARSRGRRICTWVSRGRRGANSPQQPCSYLLEE